MTLIEHLLCVRHYPKHFTCITTWMSHMCGSGRRWGRGDSWGSSDDGMLWMLWQGVWTLSSRREPLRVINKYYKTGLGILKVSSASCVGNRWRRWDGKQRSESGSFFNSSEKWKWQRMYSGEVEMGLADPCIHGGRGGREGILWTQGKKQL